MLASASADLTDEQGAIAEVAFSIGSKYGDCSFDDLDVCDAQWEDIRKAGLNGLSIPEEFGGAGGMDDLLVAIERFAAGGFPAQQYVLAQGIAASLIAKNGSDEQRQHWLTKIAEGAISLAFAMTEPDAGSNVNKLATTATKVDGGWRIRGQKTFISAIDRADAVVIGTRDPEAGGLSVFIANLPSPQLELQEVRIGMKMFERQWTVWFEDLELPDDALIGERGEGAKVLFDGLNPERLTVAAGAIGTGRWCLAKAAEYAGQRVVFDAPIGAHQAIQHPLAEALIGLEGGWALTRRAAKLYDAGHPNVGLASNIAKVAACDAGHFSADRALQTFGGSGYTDDTLMLQRMVHLRLLKTAPVSRELALNHIATRGLGLPRSY